MKKINTLIILLSIATLTYAQKSTDNITMSFDVSAYSDIRIHNFDGNVKVTTKPGNEFQLKAVRTLKAKTKSKLDEAKREVFLDTTIIDGEFIVFMQAPQKYFKIDDEGNSYYNGQNWNNWSKNDIREYGVDYEFEIEATVPEDKNLYIATHHKDVEVEGARKKTTVKSHHGNVKASTAGSEVLAKSHHGDVTVVHLNSNVTKGYYKTHHGDIKTSFPNLSAMVAMDSHLGDFFVDFDFEHVAHQVRQTKEGGKTKYKYGGDTNIKIGGGSGILRYKTYHGDTFITKN